MGSFGQNNRVKICNLSIFKVAFIIEVDIIDLCNEESEEKNSWIPCVKKKNCNEESEEKKIVVEQAHLGTP